MLPQTRGGRRNKPRWQDKGDTGTIGTFTTAHLAVWSAQMGIIKKQGAIMKGQSRRKQFNNYYLDTGKADQAVQRSMTREEKHMLNVLNPGIWAGLMAFLGRMFRFFIDNEGVVYGQYYKSVAPEIKAENNSNRKWYKTHVPKIMRRNLSNRERTSLRQIFYKQKTRYV